MTEASVPAIKAPPVKRDNPLTRSVAGIIGLSFLTVMVLACLLTLPWTLAPRPVDGTEVLPESQQRKTAPYDTQVREARHLPPWWAPGGSPARPETGGAPLSALPDSVAKRYWETAQRNALVEMARQRAVPVDELIAKEVKPTPEQVEAARPRYWLGTDLFGRSLLIRALVGGGISLGIGISAALISVLIGTLWGTMAGWIGGRTDGFMMRVVDILYGLPYILLVVLLAVASQALLDEALTHERARKQWVDQQIEVMLEREGRTGTRDSVRAWRQENPAPTVQFERSAEREFPERTMSPGWRTVFELGTLLVAIGGVSWLTMSRVVRGQVLSLKHQPFIEAARAIGVPGPRLFRLHLLPNLLGPIIVYATLTVPQAILQESFLSFLGIGVKPPMPSWGSLAADGLSELNTVDSKWWLLLFPCLLLASTLLALNFVGEGLREAFDPRRGRR